jgi:hypothetical protein
VTRLERRCRLLLQAYPAAYRRDRGDEIIATLLEATPEGHSWPSLHDVRALIVGGLKTRGAHNRHLSTATNLRAAVLVGVAVYLCCNAAQAVSGTIREEVVLGSTLVTQYWPTAWWTLAAGLLTLATIVLAWMSRRRVLVLAGALPAAVAVSFASRWQTYELGDTVIWLACLIAVVALSGGTNHPSPRWVWLLGVMAVVPVVGSTQLEYVPLLPTLLLISVAVVSIGWTLVDARPVIAVTTYLLLTEAPFTVRTVATGFGATAELPFFLVIAPIAATAVWLLRRQSAGSGKAVRQEGGGSAAH